LVSAGIDRDDVWLTNAVKHFKWTPRGKRRIHERPNRTEIVACRRWLDAELDVVRPEVVVVLGATAGQALFGSSFRVGAARGTLLDLAGTPVVATSHPSAILRTGQGEERDEAFAALVGDLRRAADVLDPDHAH
jgi:DNA polymerase